jgi:hypothetical protein
MGSFCDIKAPGMQNNRAIVAIRARLGETLFMASTVRGTPLLICQRGDFSAVRALRQTGFSRAACCPRVLITVVPQ